MKRLLISSAIICLSVVPISAQESDNSGKFSSIIKNIGEASPIFLIILENFPELSDSWALMGTTLRQIIALEMRRRFMTIPNFEINIIFILK